MSKALTISLTSFLFSQIINTARPPLARPCSISPTVSLQSSSTSNLSSLLLSSLANSFSLVSSFLSASRVDFNLFICASRLVISLVTMFFSFSFSFFSFSSISLLSDTIWLTSFFISCNQSGRLVTKTSSSLIFNSFLNLGN